MWNDFKAFVMRGNVLDLAVAVIIGGAFGAIVTSLVNDIIMPPIGMLLGGVDFKSLQVTLKDAITSPAGDVIPPVAVRYGLFINNIIDFLIVAFTIFMVVKTINRLAQMRTAKSQ